MHKFVPLYANHSGALVINQSLSRSKNMYEPVILSKDLCSQPKTRRL